MIILDRPFSNALLYQAIHDGYARHHDGKSPFSDRYLGPLLRQGFSRHLRDEVLWTMLIFGPALFKTPDNLDITSLVSRSLVDTSLITLGERASFDKSEMATTLPDFVKLFSDLLIEDIKHFGVKSPNGIHIAFADRYFRSKSFFTLQRTRDLLEISKSTEYTAFIQELDDVLGGLQLPGLPVKSRKVKLKDILNIDRKQFEFVHNYRDLIAASEIIGHRAVHWFDLLEKSNRLGLPIKANLRGKVQRSLLGRLALLKEKEGSFVGLRVWLREIEVRPKLDSINDVIRLLDNPYIRDFKEAVVEWTKRIEGGEVAAEERIRGDIRKANRELKRINKLTKVNRACAFIGVPVDLAIALSGLPIFGSSLIGAGIETYAWRKKKAVRWMMFGREN